MCYTVTYKSFSGRGDFLAAFYTSSGGNKVIERIILDPVPNLKKMLVLEELFGSDLRKSDRYSRQALNESEARQIMVLIDLLLSAPSNNQIGENLYVADGLHHSLEVTKGDNNKIFDWQIKSGKDSELDRLISFIENRIERYRSCRI